jgi:nitroreductase
MHADGFPNTMSTTPNLSVGDAIRQRRSVRAYAPGRLSWTRVGELLDAAVRAPTAAHAEPWCFIVVQDRALLKRVSTRACRLMGDPSRPEFLHRGGRAPEVFAQADVDIFHGAGTLIVIGSQVNGPFITADCWLAAENVMLQACAMGLGTCVIGSAVAALNEDAFRQEAGLPDDFTAVAPIAVGVPAETAAPAPRHAPRLLAWI